MKLTNLITDTDCYLFGNGTHYQIYEKLGAHPIIYKGTKGVYFAVWAPHAKSVSLVGDFNDWDPKKTPMMAISDSGIYEVFIPKMKEGELYKYAITTQSGQVIFKADPYATYSQVRPETASVVANISKLKWTDKKWIEKRQATDWKKAPVSIYEVHPGSWKYHEDGTWYTYRELAVELADYVKSMGYTHVELMGIAEHPFDGSWGYQVTGYYAPTARYGEPKDFAYFVDYMHKKGIGVILDWVPAHFPKDAHGLADFDGQATYEYADTRKGEHPDWGTKVFDYAKTEVSNFLIANALYWVEKFHIDALRVDAVASMLYLDYGRKEGEWVPNMYGGHENLEAIEFLKHLNSIMAKRNPGTEIIAEESTAWPQVTTAPEDGGLGFGFKWNMGWMHDFLDYMKQDPIYRKFSHNKMTFGMTYATSENFILVLSHDEVVHLKCSMLEKMPGLEDDKFANLKVAYTFYMGHPGKKLLFMGQDFAQRREWSEERELDWYLLDDPRHLDMQNYFKGLLKLYKKYSALYALDYSWDGFEWINADDGDRSIFSFVRQSTKNSTKLLFVMNFTPVERPDYKVGVPKRGKYTRILDTQNGYIDKPGTAETYTAKKEECDGKEYSIEYPLPAYGAAVFKFR
ncbi:1,4-alpha-glucan (glycogen) branching enzyme, GH-13-type [Lachnospiraceae bacterium TWA4]|nr:1,4-alpha-glucan (glycogen) branching enzyme, GH-13-type [Lachnospiraceae bacterium TWA4]